MVLAFFHPWAAFLVEVKKKKKNAFKFLICRSTAHMALLCTHGHAAAVHLLLKHVTPLKIGRTLSFGVCFLKRHTWLPSNIPPCVCLYTNNTSVYTTVPTMRRDDLCRLGWSSYIPCGQSAIRVTANKLFTLVMPGHRVDRLKDKQQRRRRHVV